MKTLSESRGAYCHMSLCPFSAETQLLVLSLSERFKASQACSDAPTD